MSFSKHAAPTLLVFASLAIAACANPRTGTFSNPAGTLPLHSAAPNFTLADAHGGSVTLSQLTAQKPVLLVFYLGYSCPRCVEHLRNLAERKPDFDAAGAQILAICPDSVADIKDSIASFGDFPFPLLSDPDMTVARSYGLLFGKDTLFHGTYLIDTHGTIRFANKSAHPYEDRENLLAILRTVH